MVIRVGWMRENLSQVTVSGSIGIRENSTVGLSRVGSALRFKKLAFG
jgi:hypothetical protein